MALATAGFTLGIRAVNSLSPHEETIPLHVSQLAEDIIRDDVQRDPIIIDNDSATVLDGMHRLAAFKKLNVYNAVCCSVDYSSAAISLGRWARVYTVKEVDSASQALRRVGDPRKTSFADAFAELQSRDAVVAALTADTAYLLGKRSGQEEVGEALSAFDRIAEEEGWGRRFVPEDDIDVSLQDRLQLVILPRRLMKEDVVSAARSGRLFPCKTSMHVVDPRPVAVDFPLGELNGSTTEKLRRRMEGKGGRLAPEGTIYEGRRYKERLLFLNQ